MSNLKLMFGTDPEIFLVEKGTTNLVPPVFLRKHLGLPVIDRSDVKHPVFFKEDGVTIMEDGALFEFTVRPKETGSGLFSQVEFAKQNLKDIADAFNFDVLHSPIADFDVKRFFDNDTLDEEERLCVVAGCDPDEDAIDSKYESGVIRDLSYWNKRGAGGHLHISTQDIPELHDLIIPAVHLLATTVGVLCVHLSDDVLAEKSRMEVFGRPGRFRPQEYPDGYLGVEYRTPSNSWLKTLEGSAQIAEVARFAFELLTKPVDGKKHIKKYLDDAVNIIVNVDKNEAENMLKVMGLF